MHFRFTASYTSSLNFNNIGGQRKGQAKNTRYKIKNH